jgi:hypothetical protein
VLLLLAATLLPGVAGAAAGGDANEPNDTPQTATTLACGATVRNVAIDPAGDVDLYRVTLTQPMAIDVDVDGHDLANTRDLVLVLRDAQGETLADDDDGLGPGDTSAALDPYLEPVPLAAGTYTVAVAGYPDFDLEGSSPERGPYSLGLGCTPTFGCVSDQRTVCIDDAPGDRRFEVKVHYRTTLGGGRSGDAGATALSALGINQGGVFHFFDARNPEIMVKVLDGCASNGRIWVFFAALTNVGFDLTVRDLKTGAEKSYVNPDRTTAGTVLDTQAFVGCGS